MEVMSANANDSDTPSYRLMVTFNDGRRVPFFENESEAMTREAQDRVARNPMTIALITLEQGGVLIDQIWSATA